MVQHPRGGVRVDLRDLDVDEQVVVRSERVEVPVRRARQHRDRLQAAAEQASAQRADVAGPRGCASASAAVSTSSVTAGSDSEVRPLLLTVARRALRQGRAGRGRRDVQPVQQRRRATRNGRVHQPGTVQGRHAGEQRQREQQRAGVGVADEPRRLRVPDRARSRAAAAGRSPAHRPTAARPPGCAGRASIAVSSAARSAAGALVGPVPSMHCPTSTSNPRRRRSRDAEVEPRPQVVRHARGRRRDADDVARSQRARGSASVASLVVRLLLRSAPGGRRSATPTRRCATDQSSIRWCSMRATSAIVPDIDG